jgi:hypothetical protein
VLKARAFSDVDFRTKTAFGEDAKAVQDAVVAKMNAAAATWRLPCPSPPGAAIRPRPPN